MSKTPSPPASAHPLQLDFFEAGTFRQSATGWVHRKTVPYTILAQAVEGAYEVRCGREHQIIAPMRVLVIPSHMPVEFTHHDGPSGKMEARWLHLRFNFFGLIDFLSRYDLPLQLPEKESRELSRILGFAMENEALCETDPLRMIRQHELGACALQVLCKETRLKEETGRTNARWERLGPVLVHIKENLSTPLTVAALARLAGMSAAKFHAIFKEEFGLSPMHYVRSTRLETAARLLIASGEKLTQIADSVGFADAFHFSHAFKAHFKTSPREYRQSAAKLYP